MIACIILNYNDYGTTKNLLCKLCKYKKLDYIVVVDNNSTDDSFSRLKMYENEKVFVLNTEENKGYGFGNNLGIKFAYYDLGVNYILIANPDIEVSENCIIHMENFLKDHKDYGIVAPVQCDENGKSLKRIAYKIPSFWGCFFCFSFVLNKIFKYGDYKLEKFKNKKLVSVECVHGALLMINAKDMIKCGLYDEDIFLYSEEETLGLRMKKIKYKTAILLNYFYKHIQGKSTKKVFSNLKIRKLQYNSKIIFLKKYYNVSSFALFFIKIFMNLTLIEYSLIILIKKIYENILKIKGENL